MANFERGVSGYLEMQATVKMAFPIDLNGGVWVCCEACNFYNRPAKRCSLNWAPVDREPGRYLGGSCPLRPVEKEEE